MSASSNKDKLRNMTKFLFAMVLLCMVTLQLSAQDLGDAVTTITQVERTSLSSKSLPGIEAMWEPFTLPLGGLNDGYENTPELWLRFKIAKPEHDYSKSLYFYRYNSAIDVYFNGNYVGGDVYREGRYTISWNRPRLIDIQPGSWVDGDNEVLVRFTPSYFGGTFAPILLGNTQEMQELNRNRWSRQIEVNQWLQAAGIFVTLLSLFFWLLQRRDHSYLLFAGIAACWTVLPTHMVTYHHILPYRYWLPLVHIAMDAWILLSFFFLANLCGTEIRRSGKLIAIWASLALLWSIVAPMSIFPEDFWWSRIYLVHSIGFGFIVYLLFKIVPGIFHKLPAAVESDLNALQKKRVAWAVVFAMVVQMVLFFRDFWLVRYGTLAEWEAVYYSQYGFPLVIAIFMTVLLHRFATVFQLAENTNQELTLQIAANTKVIEKSFSDKRQFELEQAENNERVRIYRELHDDVGSKLLSIVHEDRDSRMGNLAQAALISLRNAVSKVNTPDQYLQVFLRELQEELDLRLTGSGHLFDWKQPQELPNSIVSANILFNVNRIFKEMVSNIIRHAKAESVAVTVSMDSENCTFEITDDGVGFDKDAKPGNGINNIIARANELQTELHWSTEPGEGVTLSFSLALARMINVAKDSEEAAPHSFIDPAK